MPYGEMHRTEQSSSAASLRPGPAAAEQLGAYLSTTVHEISRWMAEFGPYQPHASLEIDGSAFHAAFDELRERLRDNYPFFHPRYVGQMLKPPHPAAVIGYLATMLINPNNHALDGGPATAQMEREAVAQLAAMFGYGAHLGHLTSSGTIANLEALFVARESHPGKGIAFSADAHYTHGRMCHLLGVPAHPVVTDGRGRIDLEALTDTPTAPYHPLRNMYVAATRRSAIDPALPPNVPRYALPLADAIRHATRDAAWACRADDRGRLEAGLLADLVVLDRDPFTDGPQALLDAQILRTVVGGRNVGGSQS
jgi:hypothetical protein